MESKKNRTSYIYDGPVMLFGKWVGDSRIKTVAQSTQKALNNVAYTFKKRKGYTPSAKIELDGKYLREGF